MHDNWITVFRERRAQPALQSLFTAKHDFVQLPDVIAEPIRRLARIEQQRKEALS
jgi:hypothetical protein